MELDRHVGTFFFVLVILWEFYPGLWEVVCFRLGAHTPSRFVTHYVISQVTELTYIWYFFIVDKFFDSPIDRSLPCRNSIVSKLYLFLSVLIFGQIKKYYSFASAEVHALHLDRRKHALDHQRDDLVWVSFISTTKSIHDE